MKPAWNLEFKREDIIEWYDDLAKLEGPGGTVYVTTPTATGLTPLATMVHSILNEGPLYLELYGELTRAIANGSMLKALEGADPATAAQLKAILERASAITHARGMYLEGK